MKLSLFKTIVITTLLGLILAGCSKEAKKERFLTKANKDFQEERYDKAEIEYLNVLQLNPQEKSAVAQLGLLYFNQGRVLRAATFLNGAVEMDPDNVDLRVRLGQTYLSIRRLKDARDQALKILEKHPGNMEAIKILSEAAVTPAEVEQAREVLAQLSLPQQQTAAYHLCMATLHYRDRQLDQAEAETRKALSLDPKSSDAHLAMASVLLARRDVTNAMPVLKTAAELAPVRSPIRLAYARFQLQQGQIDDSREEAEAIIAQAPDYIPALNFLAQLALAERRFTDCASILQRIDSRDPGNIEAMILRGDLLLAQGETPKAISQYEKVIQAYGRIPQVHYQLAVANVINGDTVRAMAHLTQTLAVEPEHADAALLMAELNLRRGEAVLAVSGISELLSKRPELTRAHLLLAEAHLAMRNPSQAVAIYRKLVSRFPNNPEVPVRLAVILAQQGNLAEARKAFDLALERVPDFVGAVEGLVEIDLREGKSDQAMERVLELIERKPQAAEPWSLKARIHLVKREDSEAEAALLKAIEIRPDFTTPYFKLVQLYTESNKHQQALERLNGLVSRKTNDIAALLLIGGIHDQLKDYPAARQAYEKVLVINPNQGVALNNLAYLLAERFGEIDRAVDLAERARRNLPYDPSPADTLGWVLYRKGDYTRALALLQESAARLRDRPEIQYHLGMAYYMLAEEEPARAALQAAVDMEGDFPGKELAREKLALLSLVPTQPDPSTISSLEAQSRENPTDPIILSKLAATHAAKGDFAAAAGAYESLLKSHPRNVRIIAMLADLYKNQLNNTEKALALARTGYGIAPENPDICRILGQITLDAGEPQRALPILERGASRSSQPELLQSLAWAYYSQGRVDEAESTMRRISATADNPHTDAVQRFLRFIQAARTKATAVSAQAQAAQILATEPKYVPALVVSALAQEAAGNYSKAVEIYETVLIIYPGFSPAIRNLAMAYAKHLKDPDKAFPLAIKAREAYPNDVDLARTLGLIAYERGDFSRSAQLLQECLARGQSDAELQFYLGMSYYQTKRPTQSKDLLSKSIGSGLKPELVEEARKALADLK